MKNKGKGDKAIDAHKEMPVIKAKLVPDKKATALKPKPKENKEVKDDACKVEDTNLVNSTCKPVEEMKEEKEEAKEEFLLTGVNIPHSSPLPLQHEEEVIELPPKAYDTPITKSIVVTYSEQENYLKDKLEQMKAIANTNIKSNTDTIGLTLNKIQHEEIVNNQFLIPETQMEFNPLLKLQKDKQDSYDYHPESLRLLHRLRKSEVNLRRKIESIDENQKLLSNESDINLLKSTSNSIDKSVRQAQISQLNDKKKLFTNKLEVIHQQIKDLLMNEQRLDKKNVIKTFISNFDTDKAAISKQVIQIELKSAVDREKMQKDKSESLDKRIREIEQKEQELLESKEKNIRDNMQKEKEAMMRRKLEIDKKLDKTKQFIQLKSSHKAKDYLFNKMNEAYIFKEKKLIEKIKMSKRMKGFADKDNQEEKAKSLEEKNEKLSKEAKEKALMMKEIWRNRSQLIPSYRNPIEKIVENELKQFHEQEDLNRLKPIVLAKEKKLFSEQNIPQPRPNSQLRRQREERMNKISSKALSKKKKKEHSLDIKQHRSFQIKSNQIIKSFSAVHIDLKYNTKPPIRKPQRFISFHKRHVNVMDKAPDYLTEQRKNKPFSNGYCNDWNRIAADPKGTPIENIKLIIAQTTALEIKAQQKKELLRLGGGYASNMELGESLGELLVDSIKAKLAIMRALKSREMKKKVF